MSKRSLPYRRNETEIKKRVYADMIKYPGKINPIFLQKPYSACKGIKKKDKEG